MPLEHPLKSLWTGNGAEAFDHAALVSAVCFRFYVLDVTVILFVRQVAYVATDGNSADFFVRPSIGTDFFVLGHYITSLAIEPMPDLTIPPAARLMGRCAVSLVAGSLKFTTRSGVL